MKNKQVGLSVQAGSIPILILLALAILGLAIYLGCSYLKEKEIDILRILQVSKKPIMVDETIDWQIYTNTNGNFSFKIPSKLKIENEYEYDPRYVRNKDILRGLEIKDKTFTEYVLTIYNSNGLVLSDWLNRKDNYAIPKEVVNTDNFNIGDLNVSVFEGHYDIFFIFIRKSEIFCFQSHKDDKNNPKQILSTFKFTD